MNASIEFPTDKTMGKTSKRWRKELKSNLDHIKYRFQLQTHTHKGKRYKVHYGTEVIIWIFVQWKEWWKKWREEKRSSTAKPKSEIYGLMFIAKGNLFGIQFSCYYFDWFRSSFFPLVRFICFLFRIYL